MRVRETISIKSELERRLGEREDTVEGEERMIIGKNTMQTKTDVTNIRHEGKTAVGGETMRRKTD